MSFIISSKCARPWFELQMFFEKQARLTCFVLVSCVFAYREYSVWGRVSELPLMSLPCEKMTDCSEKPASSSDSLHSAGGERRRKSNIASGPPYGYIWSFSLDQSAEPVGAWLCSLHAPFQTPQIAVSQWAPWCFRAWLFTDAIAMLYSLHSVKL